MLSVSGVQDRKDHEDLQTCKTLRGAPVHCAHSEDQLEGLGPPLPLGRDGHAGVRQPRVLHRARPGGHRLHLHTPGDELF